MNRFTHTAVRNVKWYKQPRKQSSSSSKVEENGELVWSGYGVFFSGWSILILSIYTHTIYTHYEHIHTMEYIRVCAYIHSGILLTHKKIKPAVCDNMDEP